MKISKKELEKLTEEGLITPQQAEQITAYYEKNYRRLYFTFNACICRLLFYNKQ